MANIQEQVSKRDIEQAVLFLNVVLAFSKRAIHLFVPPSPEAMNFLLQLAAITRTPDLEIFQDFTEFWEEFLN